MRPTDEDESTPDYETTLFSFLIGGGSIAKDVSMFFTWTPFPDPSLHQARIGIHNIAAGTLGDGTFNVRVGELFLLDFQRPGHRFLAPGAASATSVAVGLNRFVLDNPTIGLQFYGRPKWGPFAYELAVVAGDPGDEGTERDDWKDVFSRLSYILFYNTDHELRIGAFGYLGRSDISTDFGGVMVNQRDDFWIGGGDVEFDFGPINLSGMGYFSRHSDALPDGDSVDFIAARAEGIWSISDNWMTSVRFEYVDSDDDRSLDRKLLAPHLTYLIATNALFTLVWRQDLENSHNSSGVAVLDVAF